MEQLLICLNSVNKLFLVQNCILTPAGKVTNKLSPLYSFKIAKRSEAKSAERNFASECFDFIFLARSFASLFKLRYA